MGRNHIMLTRNTPESLAAVGKQRITNRYEPCRCGCAGRDPWHQSEYVRVIRNVQVHDEPVELSPRRPKYNLPAKIEVARGIARFPFGECEVRAVARVSESGPSLYVDWERVQ